MTKISRIINGMRAGRDFTQVNEKCRDIDFQRLVSSQAEPKRDETRREETRRDETRRDETSRSWVTAFFVCASFAYRSPIMKNLLFVC